MTFNEGVSVILPVFNQDSFIVRALVSVNEQSFIRWQLIVDDSSTDETGLTANRREARREIKQMRKELSHNGFFGQRFLYKGHLEKIQDVEIFTLNYCMNFSCISELSGTYPSISEDVILDEVL